MGFIMNSEESDCKEGRGGKLQDLSKEGDVPSSYRNIGNETNPQQQCRLFFCYRPHDSDFQERKNNWPWLEWNPCSHNTSSLPLQGSLDWWEERVSGAREHGFEFRLLPLTSRVTLSLSLLQCSSLPFCTWGPCPRGLMRTNWVKL